VQIALEEVRGLRS